MTRRTAASATADVLGKTLPTAVAAGVMRKTARMATATRKRMAAKRRTTARKKSKRRKR